MSKDNHKKSQEFSAKIIDILGANGEPTVGDAVAMLQACASVVLGITTNVVESCEIESSSFLLVVSDSGKKIVIELKQDFGEVG